MELFFVLVSLCCTTLISAVHPQRNCLPAESQCIDNNSCCDGYCHIEPGLQYGICAPSSLKIIRKSFIQRRTWWHLTRMKRFRKVKTIDYEKFKVVVLPALTDNFMYLLIDKGTKEAAIVDVASPDIVWEALRTENVKLTTILTTHHHWDHVNGNLKIINKANGTINVIGGDDRIDGLSVMIDKQEVDLHFGSLKIKCIRTPSHTTGDVSYYVSAGQEGVVFTGDTLFVGGCGKFFEGNATQMYEALIKKLSQLPDNTAVFCGHEYTYHNLLFGLKVEPHNHDILSLFKEVEVKRENYQPTVPSTIGMEKRINPFMRVEQESVQKFTHSIGNPIETMQILREKKNNFKEKIRTPVL